MIFELLDSPVLKSFWDIKHAKCAWSLQRQRPPEYKISLPVALWCSRCSLFLVKFIICYFEISAWNDRKMALKIQGKTIIPDMCCLRVTEALFSLPFALHDCPFLVLFCAYQSHCCRPSSVNPFSQKPPEHLRQILEKAICPPYLPTLFSFFKLLNGFFVWLILFLFVNMRPYGRKN